MNNPAFVSAVCNLIDVHIYRTYLGGEDDDSCIDATDHYVNAILDEIRTDPELAQLRAWADAIDDALDGCRPALAPHEANQKEMTGSRSGETAAKPGVSP